MKEPRNYFILVLTLFIVLAAAWQWTPLHHWVDLDSLTLWGKHLRSLRWTPVIVPLIYVGAGLLAISHALLIWATAFTFPPMTAFVYAELGSLLSGMAVYGVGRVLRQDFAHRLAGSSWDRLSRSLGRHGVITIVTLHIFPIASFSILNLVAGASHIRFRDFLIGTVLGVSPGIIVVCIFGERLIQTLRHPQPLNWVYLGLFVLSAWFLLSRLRHRLLPVTETANCPQTPT
ncbi:MAG: VTT domain-containing protein [Elusimicrobiota bacterium]|jgi:uncharacterized membrane protein YdjX (TVP38/TMEM64 family)